jgi:hypothetical protein
VTSFHSNQWPCIFFFCRYFLNQLLRSEWSRVWSHDKKTLYFQNELPYFTDDRSIFFLLNTLASTYRPHRPIQGCWILLIFFGCWTFFFPELHALLVYFYSPTTSMISVFLFRKKTYSKFKVYYRILRTIGQYFFSSTRWLRPIVHIDLYKDEVIKIWNP